MLPVLNDQTTNKEVLDEIRNMISANACGLDGLTSRILVGISYCFFQQRVSFRLFSKIMIRTKAVNITQER